LNGPFASRWRTTFSATVALRPETFGGGVHLDADRVDARYDDVVELALEGGLIDVMLILPHADALGVDLDQLGQRVHEAAPDRDGAANGHVLVGELLARDGRGGVHRRT
jgi:hypothetical protein